MQHYKDRSAIRNYTSDQLDWADKLLNSEFVKKWKSEKTETCTIPYDKYLNETDTFLSEKLAILNFLKLTDSPPKSIFDIGTGVGHFLTLAKALGHTAEGSDIPESVNYLKDIHLHYNINVVELSIYKQTEFKLPTTYDIITTARVVFDYENGHPNWSANDWNFFKENVFEYLNTNGKFFIKTNIKHVYDLNVVNNIVEAYGDRLEGWNSITYLLTKK